MDRFNVTQPARPAVYTAVAYIFSGLVSVGGGQGKGKGEGNGSEEGQVKGNGMR